MGIVVGRQLASQYQVELLQPFPVLHMVEQEHMEGSTSSGKGVQFFYCQGYGHYSTQFPNHMMGLSNKQPMMEEVYILLQLIIL